MLCCCDGHRKTQKHPCNFLNMEHFHEALQNKCQSLLSFGALSVVAHCRRSLQTLNADAHCSFAPRSPRTPATERSDTRNTEQLQPLRYHWPNQVDIPMTQPANKVPYRWCHRMQATRPVACRFTWKAGVLRSICALKKAAECLCHAHVLDLRGLEVFCWVYTWICKHWISTLALKSLPQWETW